MQGPAGAQTLRHVEARGLGDVSLQAEYWLSDPAVPSRVTGSVGFGFLAPTGRDDVRGTVYNSGAGADVRAPLDEAVQPGTGGWALLFRAQGTAWIKGPFAAYGSAFYGLSLTEHTDVKNNPASTLRGIPDIYSGRLGAAYLLPFFNAPGSGIVASLGG